MLAAAAAAAIVTSESDDDPRGEDAASLPQDASLVTFSMAASELRSTSRPEAKRCWVPWRCREASGFFKSPSAPELASMSAVGVRPMEQ